MPGPNERLVRLSDDEAERLAKFYAEAESQILDEINRALLKGNQTKYLQAMLTNVQAILKDLRDGSRTWCETAIPRIYTEGASFIDEQVEQVGGKVIAGFAAIHQQAAQILAESSHNRFEEVIQLIGRRVNDIYRTVQLEAAMGTVTGFKTWQQAAQRIRENLAEHGITGFVDKAKREWSMRTYAEMAARTVAMEAHLEGTKNRLLEHGSDLIKISSHSKPCSYCRPWEGKILSLTGKTPGYPTLEEAKAAKLFHPRCKHAYGAYIPELAGD